MESVNSKVLECGVATRALPGESESGDRHLVEGYHNGVLVAVVDGLGHGTEAAEAAKISVRTLEQHAAETVISLLKRCHASLSATRGVVMSLASFNAPEGTMTWLGVGNVEGVLAHSDSRISPDREGLLLRGGVVGSQLPGLRASVLPVFHGDLLIFATDGITNDFAGEINFSDHPQGIADRIMDRHSKGTDDALVLVVRYLGYTR